jgi:hypothetical protein
MLKSGPLSLFQILSGGEGIRTPGGLTTTPVFKGVALRVDDSASLAVGEENRWLTFLEKPVLMLSVPIRAESGV